MAFADGKLTKQTKTAMGETLIRFSHVQKSFGAKKIYTDLNLELKRGETTTIMGASGSGKSVCLKMLIGLLKADSGSIVFDGDDISQMNEDGLHEVRRRIAYLFQGAALFDSLTVGENVAYGLREQFWNTMTDEEIRARASHSLELVSLPGVEDMRPSDLSGGMRKRVGLARTLALQPEVILYDEPTTGLDPINTGRINHLITGIQKALKLTSIVVTHDMGTAFSVSDRLVMIARGKVLLTGTKEEWKKHDEHVRARLHRGRAPRTKTSSRCSELSRIREMVHEEGNQGGAVRRDRHPHAGRDGLRDRRQQADVGAQGPVRRGLQGRRGAEAGRAGEARRRRHRPRHARRLQRQIERRAHLRQHRREEDGGRACPGRYEGERRDEGDARRQDARLEGGEPGGTRGPARWIARNGRGGRHHREGAAAPWQKVSDRLDEIGKLTKPLSATRSSSSDLSGHRRQPERDHVGAIAHNDSAVHRLLMDPREGERIDIALANVDNATMKLSSMLGSMQDVADHVRRGPGIAHAVLYDGEMSKNAAATLDEIHQDLQAIRTGNGLAHAVVYGDDNTQHVLGNVNAMSDDLRTIVAQMTDGKGTIGGLLVDPSIYEDLKSAVGNVERNQVLRALVRYSIKEDESKSKPDPTVSATKP